MKIKYLFGILLIIGILVMSSCAQQQTKYVCPDGSTVSDDSLCPKETREYCGDNKCNNNENCKSCPSDCGNCPINCEVTYGPKTVQGIKVKDIKCVDETGEYWGESGAHCDWDNTDSNVPGQSHRSSKIVKDRVTCQNNRCVVESYVVKDCSKYDTSKETALCGEDPVSELPVCSLYANDGSYYKPLE